MVQLHERIVENIKKVIKGKDEKIKLVLAEMYAGGHVLLEDVPGVGKTVLARSIAVSLGFDLSAYSLLQICYQLILLAYRYTIEKVKISSSKKVHFSRIYSLQMR